MGDCTARTRDRDHWRRPWHLYHDLGSNVRVGVLLTRLPHQVLMVFDGRSLSVNRERIVVPAPLLFSMLASFAVIILTVVIRAGSGSLVVRPALRAGRGGAQASV